MSAALAVNSIVKVTDPPAGTMMVAPPGNE
jgi:hypothetical protein